MKINIIIQYIHVTNDNRIALNINWIEIATPQFIWCKQGTNKVLVWG